jgi:hypothetical protein
MFDTLTLRELYLLSAKLYSAGHAFFEAADAIGSTALYMEETGRISALSDAWDGLWMARQPLADAMEEMHELAFEVSDLAAVSGA